MDCLYKQVQSWKTDLAFTFDIFHCNEVVQNGTERHSVKTILVSTSPDYASKEFSGLSGCWLSKIGKSAYISSLSFQSDSTPGPSLHHSSLRAFYYGEYFGCEILIWKHRMCADNYFLSLKVVKSRKPKAKKLNVTSEQWTCAGSCCSPSALVPTED